MVLQLTLKENSVRIRVLLSHVVSYHEIEVGVPGDGKLGTMLQLSTGAYHTVTENIEKIDRAFAKKCK